MEQKENKINHAEDKERSVVPVRGALVGHGVRLLDFQLVEVEPELADVVAGLGTSVDGGGPTFSMVVEHCPIELKELG